MSYSSDKKHKLIFENWRRFLKEENEPATAANVAAKADTDTLVKSLMNLDLSSFIQQVSVKPYQSAILSGLAQYDGDPDDDKFQVEEVTIICRKLRPTQNEVVMSKSLEFPLEHPKDFIRYRAGGTFKVGPPGNNAIITFGGKYVVDGHHRWSALYCCNPNAKITAWNITKPGIRPDDVLKVAQAAIYSISKKIPSAKGGGINLFATNEGTVRKYIHGVIARSPALIEIYSKYLSKEKALVKEGPMDLALVVAGLANIIWPNIEVLKSESQPISNATPRPSMPQTDRLGPVTAGGSVPKALEPLAKGVINIAAPFEKGKK